jgi:hypothetical protein
MAMAMTLQLLYRYRPVPLLRPLQVQVRPIMSSQPQILSIEDLNTTDAKYVFRRNIPQKATGPGSHHPLDISEKVGQPEED